MERILQTSCDAAISLGKNLETRNPASTGMVGPRPKAPMTAARRATWTKEGIGYRPLVILHETMLHSALDPQIEGVWPQLSTVRGQRSANSEEADLPR